MTKRERKRSVTPDLATQHVAVVEPRAATPDLEEFCTDSGHRVGGVPLLQARQSLPSTLAQTFSQQQHATVSSLQLNARGSPAQFWAMPSTVYSSAALPPT